MNFFQYLHLYGKQYHTQSRGRNTCYDLPFEFFQQIIDEHDLNKDSICELLTQAINLKYNFTITVKEPELNKLINHYSLFNNVHQFTDDIAEKYFEMLRRSVKKFKVKLTDHLFDDYYKLDNIKWIYQQCDDEDKKLFDQCISTEQYMNGEFVTWYAKETNNIPFIFNVERFQNIHDADTLKDLLDSVGYQISIKDLNGLYVDKDVFEYVVTVCKEKDDPLEMYKGVLNIYLDTTLKKRYLWNLIKKTDNTVEYFYETCRSLLNNNPIVRLFIKNSVTYKKFHFLMYTGGEPNGNDLKIIQQMGCDKRLLIDMAYYFFDNNEKWGFNSVCNWLGKDIVDIDMDTINRIYSKKSTVEFTCDLNNYEMKIVDCVDKRRRHKYKKVMLNYFELKKMDYD